MAESDSIGSRSAPHELGREDASLVRDAEASSGAVLDPAWDAAAFHEELRRRNLTVLFWSGCVFNVVYVAWTGFDYVLSPAHWGEFLALRLAAAGVNTLVVLLVHRPRFQRYTWEAFWLYAFVFGAAIAPMLPVVGGSYPAYVLGFSIVLVGTGLLPFWRPSWAVSCLTSIIASAGAAFVIRDTNVSYRDIVGSVFLAGTAAGLSLAVTFFKYGLVKRDYVRRLQLQAAARREADAHVRLARASGELQAALTKLQQLDRLKNAFFANVSHELRTPLTLIMAPLEKFAESVTDEGEQRQIRLIQRNATRLLRLIDELLDLARLDAGGLRLNLAEVDIRAVAAIVHENGLPAALARSIDFRYVADKSSTKIVGDAHRLEIVLTNLVGNALKFTPGGGRIDLEVRDAPDGVQVRVADNGEGIRPDDLPHVFERFFQASPTGRARRGGVGIGLALAKELVELHGGRISVVSQPGAGATFEFFVPFGRDHLRQEVIERRQAYDPAHLRRRTDDPEPGSSAPEMAAPSPATARLTPSETISSTAGARPRSRVLIVEDHDDVREFLRSVLEEEFDVLVAVDGDEGWAAVRRERPELVISDVMMPGRSGTDLCKSIKADPALRPTPVILLTARAGSEATLEGYAHGADDFVAKPFHPRVLLARVRAQLTLRALSLQLAESEKLAVVGTLAAGILHEVRNPLNALVSAAQVLGEGKTPPETAARLLGVIRDASGRIQEITTALESHARPAEALESVATDVREGLEATLRLLEHRMATVNVHREYATNRRVRVRAGPLNQAFLNLLDNALRSGATNIWISAALVAGKVVVAVEDDGPGVPAEIAPRIFDPFFSTRAPGSGTGLGLYLSRKIVEEEGGRLWLEARAEGGARFVLELPVLEET